VVAWATGGGRRAAGCGRRAAGGWGDDDDDNEVDDRSCDEVHCYRGIKFCSFLLRICVGKSPYILFGTRGLFGYAVEKIMYIRTMWYIALVDILKWLQELAMR
jgi:hypothetical protein